MNSRFSLMLIVALLFAGGAAWMAKRWVDSQTAPKIADQSTVPVVVAAARIPFATRFEAAHVKIAAWPKNAVPAETFSEVTPVLGQIAQRDFYPNEPILAPQIAEHAGGSTLSALITPGMRAMSVRVNDVAGVAGFILPGNRADIIATSNETQNAYTLLKNMKILAIDQSVSTEEGKKAVIVQALTLEVTPRQAEILVEATKNSSLMFTLRNPMDEEQGPIVESNINTPEVKIKPVPAPPSVSITILPWKNQTPIQVTN